MEIYLHIYILIAYIYVYIYMANSLRNKEFGKYYYGKCKMENEFLQKSIFIVYYLTKFLQLCKVKYAVMKIKLILTLSRELNKSSYQALLQFVTTYVTENFTLNKWIMCTSVQKFIQFSDNRVRCSPYRLDPRGISPH